MLILSEVGSYFGGKVWGVLEEFRLLHYIDEITADFEYIDWFNLICRHAADLDVLC